eukprot:3346199-Rhodomonas_salina.4
MLLRAGEYCGECMLCTDRAELGMVLRVLRRFRERLLRALRACLYRTRLTVRGGFVPGPVALMRSQYPQLERSGGRGAPLSSWSQLVAQYTQPVPDVA